MGSVLLVLRREKEGNEERCWRLTTERASSCIYVKEMNKCDGSFDWVKEEDLLVILLAFFFLRQRKA